MRKDTQLPPNPRNHDIRDAPEGKPINVQSLGRCYWQHRERPVLLFIECDTLFRSETTCNMLKVIYDKQRTVSVASVGAIKNREYLVPRYLEWVETSS
jgi:hypothetical protein